jgi:putative glutamine amidotransferase
VNDLPRIGITTGTERDWQPGGPAYEAYAAAIRTGGGQPVRLDATGRGREPALVRGLDGLLLTGGWDIDLRAYPNPPELDGEPPGQRMARRHMRVEPERDRYELPLARAALDADLPLLGICRGCQLLYVALGGRLILDIASEVQSPIRHPSFPEPERLSSSHPLSIVPGTRLAAILPPDRYEVANSRHHQAVLPDPDLPVKIAAICPVDGIVEAFELPGRAFVLGVQWHPEHPKDPEIRAAHQPLFAAFVEACR